MAAQNTPARLGDFDPRNPIYWRNGRALHPICHTCGWRMGGPDSWDGTRCKCRRMSPSFPQLCRGWCESEAAAHEAEAERLDALDNGGDCEVAASYHATRASQIRAALSATPEGAE